MKTKSIKILINIGSIDAERLHLGHDHLYMEGEVVSLDETIADKLIAERKAREHDADSQKEDLEAAGRQREAAIQAAMPAAEREIAMEDAKAEAVKRLKNRPAATQPVTPSTISDNPHSGPVRKTS